MSFIRNAVSKEYVFVKITLFILRKKDLWKPKTDARQIHRHSQVYHHISCVCKEIDHYHKNQVDDRSVLYSRRPCRFFEYRVKSVALGLVQFRIHRFYTQIKFFTWNIPKFILNIISMIFVRFIFLSKIIEKSRNSYLGWI